MGREIRRVIPNWEHPKHDVFDRQFGGFKSIHKPLYDKCVEDEYYATPPDPNDYRPSWDEESATWYQMYETVSEGTPLTPPFESQDELIFHLVNHGCFWYKKPWSIEAATNFVKVDKWMISGLFVNGNIVDLTQEVLP